jgi:hypothetical protein
MAAAARPIRGRDLATDVSSRRVNASRTFLECIDHACEACHDGAYCTLSMSHAHESIARHATHREVAASG